MFEQISAAERPADVVASEKHERSRIILVSGAILFAITVAAVLLRLYRLAEIPPGLFFDEGAHGVDAIQVLQGKHTPFFPDNSGREALIVYAIALTHSILGRSIWAVRLPTALASAGAALTLFWAGYVIFGTDEQMKTPRPWRGVFIGGAAAALLAVSLNHLVLGRLAFRANFLLLLLPLCLALLWQGWRQHSWLKIALAGLCAGVIQYTYTPARLLPVLLLLFGLTFLIPLNDNAMGRLREGWRRAALFAAAAGLVAAPLVLYFASYPDHMLERIRQVTLFAPVKTGGDPLGTLLLNVWDHLLVFGFRGDPNWSHNYESLPMLNSWEALFFWLGLALSLWRWRTHATSRLLLIWLVVMLLPAALSRDSYPHVPNTLRMMGAAPAVYLLIASALWEAFQLFKKRVPAVTPVLISLLSIAILARGILTYRTYFQKYELSARSQEDFHGQWTEAALELSAIPPADEEVYLILSDNGFRPYGFDYLYEGGAPVYIVNGRGPGMPYGADARTLRQTLFRLAAEEGASSIALLDWDDEDEQEMFDLLGRYGRFTGSQQFSSFEIHTFTDLTLQLPWRFYEQLESRQVSYDAGINLLGLAVGQGAEQINSQEVISLDSSQPLWVGMRWQAERNDFDFKVSLRLYDAAGAYSYQKDRLLKNLDADTTTGWTPGQPVDTLVFLDIPPDLPPGLYELRLIVYDAETLTPTVEIDVWEPEVVLARLRFIHEGHEGVS